jgi:hypothetical protein
VDVQVIGRAQALSLLTHGRTRSAKSASLSSAIFASIDPLHEVVSFSLVEYYAWLGTSVGRTNYENGSPMPSGSSNDHDACGEINSEGREKKMRKLTAALFAGSLMFSVPMAFADDFIIAPDIGIHFHDDVKVKKYKARKYDGDVKVGVVLSEDVEYYDVPEKVVVAHPTYKSYRYAYINDRVYLVDNNRKVIAVVE